ncbi:hypothetical protein FPRO04_12320 [Fusarium proliferatum]|nr:hypothetical protein FPRO04_12320 [Fusarium proliferatum]
MNHSVERECDETSRNESNWTRTNCLEEGKSCQTPSTGNLWRQENLSADRQYDQTGPTAKSQISEGNPRIVPRDKARATNLYLEGRRPEIAAGREQTTGTGTLRDLKELPVAESDLVKLTGWKKSGTTWETLGIGGVTGRIPQKAGTVLAGETWHLAEDDGVSQQTLEF